MQIAVCLCSSRQQMQQSTELAEQLQQLSLQVSSLAASLEVINDKARAAQAKHEQSYAQISSIHNKVVQFCKQNANMKKIKFDVRGAIFTISASILQNEPNNTILQGATLNDDGEYCIDREAKYFAIILNYLRAYSVYPAIENMSLQEEAMFKQEVQFYNVKLQVAPERLAWASCHPNLQIQNHTRVTVLNHQGNCMPCVANRACSTGVHAWNLHIVVMKKQYIAFGVAVVDEIAPTSVNDFKKLYGCTSHGIKVQHDNGTPIQRKWKQGSLVKMVLRPESGQLMIDDLVIIVPKQVLLVPIVMMGHKGTVVEIAEVRMK